MNKLMDQTLSWKHIDWIKTITMLPIIIKGILTGSCVLIDNSIDISFPCIFIAEDATEALKHGVSGIAVSNHGARQLDSCPTPVLSTKNATNINYECHFL